ncbi:MAG TPA: hypothetical protein PLD27_04805 [bacterium]|nr:hypothetical protein [bacterium]HOL47732.1 hypothetical protein [bacterium]HPQ18034.1 hypothetical protein [bacterium]
MKKNFFIFFIFLINYCFANGILDLSLLPDTPIDLSTLKEYQIIEGNQQGINYFYSGYKNFNELNYFSAVDNFSNAILKAPWDKRFFEWYYKSIYKIGEYEYLKTFFNKANLYNFYSNEMKIFNNFIENKLSYKKYSTDLSYKFFKSENGFNWNEKKFITPTDITISDNFIFIICPTLKQLSILDKNFNLINKIKFSGKPIKIAEYKNYLYIIDFETNKIFKIAGEQITEIKTTNIKLLGIKGIAIDKYENIYLIDSGNKRIIKLKDDKLLLEIGGWDNKNYKFYDITDLAVDNDLNIYVIDNEQKELLKFNSSGNLIKKSKLTNQIERIKIINGKIYLLTNSNSIIEIDQNLMILNTIKIEETIKQANSFYFDAFNNLYLSSLYDSNIHIFKTIFYETAPIVINLSAIESIKHYPIIAIYADVYDIYGNPIYGLTKDNLLVYEGFNHKFEEKIYENNFYKTEDDSEKIYYKKLFLVTPINIKPINELNIYKNKEINLCILNDTSNISSLLDAINLSNTKINLTLFSDTLIPLLKQTTNIYQIRREIQKINFSVKIDFYNCMLNLINKNLTTFTNKLLILFVDDIENIDISDTQFKYLVNLINSNQLKIIIYSATTKPNKTFIDLINLTDNKYYLYPNYNFRKNLEESFNKPINKYLITYETGYTGMKFNTYMPVYIFINYYGMKGSLLTGYLTP